MIVERIWTGNNYRNFNYLVACSETGEAIAIDPLDHGQCLQRAKVKGYHITLVLNTHEHADHTGGNYQMIKATGAKLMAHHKVGSKILGVDRGVSAGDVIKIGRTVELECLDTPGHTMCHICLRAHGDQPALFSGDTLFNAGAGNCHNGGDVNLLYDSFADQISKLPDDTKLYAGHDYIENNLRFTLAREPDNDAAMEMMPRVVNHDANRAVITTLGEEKKFNTFLRLRSPSVIEKLRKDFPDLPDKPDPRTVFTKLRELRNKW